MEKVQWRFTYGAANAREIQDVLDELAGELREPDSPEAHRLGLGGAAISFEAVEERHGAEPASTIILIGIAISVGGNIANKVWNDLAWPRIKRRLGVDALGRPVDSSDE